MTVPFGRTIVGIMQPREEIWYSGEIVSLNGNGTYEVWVKELNVVYPQVNRVGPDKRRLSPLDRCHLRRNGLALEIM